VRSHSEIMSLQGDNEWHIPYALCHITT